MRKLLFGIVAASTALTALPAAATAQPGYYDRSGYGYENRRDDRRYDDRRYDNRRYDRRYDNRYDRRYDNRRGNSYGNYYDNRGYYSGPTWRGNDGRYYCRRSDGSAGTLIGGAAGALIGSSVAGRGDRTLGAIIGGVLGAVVGNSVDRDNGNRRCR